MRLSAKAHEPIKEPQPLVAFTGGGTGGHIYPGLAVIQALRERGFKGRVVWLGSKKPLDRTIVERENIEYFALPSGKLRRSFSLHNLIDAFRVIAGYAASLRILSALKPALVFSKGGYVSVPPCRAAAALGIPYFTHESDASPGLATRLNAGRAAKILLSWPATLPLLAAPLRAKALVVGNPVRPALFRGDAEKGRRFLGAPEALPIVLFVGGSQGSRQINDFVEAIRSRLDGKAFIAHQTGKELFDPALHAKRPGSYKALAYIGEEMSDILAACSVVAGRAGAGTVWESAAMGKAMVLIPLEGAGTRGDQVENAKMAEQAGAAVCLNAEKANPEALFAAVWEYLTNEKARAAAAEAGKLLGTVKTASENPVFSSEYIADLIIDEISRRARRAGR